jgi:GNAT superfamily N-acetyltransferase
MSDHQTDAAIEYRLIAFDELESDPEWPGLVAEYANECHIAGMPPCEYQGDTYRAMETTGMVRLIGAYLDGRLVGFCNLIVSRLPHYGKIVGTAESLFVGQEHRRTGAGLGLIKAAERTCAEAGAVAMLMSAPANGSMDRLMPRIGYRHTNTVFFRAFD